MFFSYSHIIISKPSQSNVKNKSHFKMLLLSIFLYQFEIYILMSWFVSKLSIFLMKPKSNKNSNEAKTISFIEILPYPICVEIEVIWCLSWCLHRIYVLTYHHISICLKTICQIFMRSALFSSTCVAVNESLCICTEIVWSVSATK